MSTVHRNLTGADLHEPKGVETALAGMVYVANGSGSGTWVAASSVITNSAFTTGDLKPTHKTTADSTWIMWVDGTIGDSSSSATVRANADTQALYTLYWNNYSDVLCPVTGGRGVSAAADFAAHKPITLPRGPGRALGVAGSGTGLTSRAIGFYLGEETHVLTTSEMPKHRHSVFLVDPGHTHSSNAAVNSGGSTTGGGAFSVNVPGAATISSATTGISITSGDSVPNSTLQAGGDAAHNNIQPTTFINVMIKL